MAARDFSRAGETFIDYKGEAHEILYSILTPLGYHAYVSAQALEHIEKHPVAAKHKMEIRTIDPVVEFIVGSSKRIVFNDEDQPGLEVGREKEPERTLPT